MSGWTGALAGFHTVLRLTGTRLSQLLATNTGLKCDILSGQGLRWLELVQEKLTNGCEEMSFVGCCLVAVPLSHTEEESQ